MSAGLLRDQACPAISDRAGESRIRRLISKLRCLVPYISPAHLANNTKWLPKASWLQAHYTAHGPRAQAGPRASATAPAASPGTSRAPEAPNAPEGFGAEGRGSGRRWKPRGQAQGDAIVPQSTRLVPVFGVLDSFRQTVGKHEVFCWENLNVSRALQQ